MKLSPGQIWIGKMYEDDSQYWLFEIVYVETCEAPPPECGHFAIAQKVYPKTLVPVGLAYCFDLDGDELNGDFYLTRRSKRRRLVARTRKEQPCQPNA